MPAGVPLGKRELPPPPQAVHSKTRSIVSARLKPSPSRRRRTTRLPIIVRASNQSNCCRAGWRPQTLGLGGSGKPSAGGIPTERAVVVTVAVASTEDAPSSTMELGETKQEAAGGAPAHVSTTDWANPPSGASFKEKAADVPADMVCSVVKVPIEKSCPTPARVTTCGLSGASSLIVSAPFRVPPALGVNVTLIMQLAPTATESPRVFVWAKSPLALMLLMVSGALPLLVRVTV